MKAQKVKVAKAQMRGPSLTWWKFVQAEREKKGKIPIASWNGIVANVKDIEF